MKKLFTGSLCVALLLACFAFTRPAGYAGTQEKSSPVTGYFHFNASLGSATDPMAYEYIGQQPPVADCGATGSIICTILADLNDNGSALPADWKPDFSADNPVDNPSAFTYLTKRN